MHTVYAKSKEDCEVLFEQMIVDVRERIQAEKQRMKAENLSKKRISS